MRLSSLLEIKYQVVVVYVTRPYLPSESCSISAAPDVYATCVAAALQVASVSDDYLTRTGSVALDSVANLHVRLFSVGAQP